MFSIFNLIENQRKRVEWEPGKIEGVPKVVGCHRWQKVVNGKHMKHMIAVSKWLITIVSKYHK